MTALRFYLPRTGSPVVTPAQTVGWDANVSTGLVVLPSSTTKSSTSLGNVTHSDANTTDQDIVFRQYVVTAPLAAQTIASQTVKWQIGALESAGSNNLFTAIMIYTVDAAGVQKNLLTATVQRDGTEIVALPSSTNRGHSFTTTAVAAATGDYLVIEIGVGGDPTFAGSHTATIRVGDNAASDLPEDDTSTLDYNPWVEFDLGFTFFVGASVTSVVATSTAAATGPVPNVIVNSVAATATGAAKTPVRVGDRAVTTVVSTAAAAAGVPFNVGNPNATITAVKAAATAASGVPSVTITVTSAASTATGAAGIPSVSAIGEGASFVIPGPEALEVYVGTAKCVYAQFIDADGNFYNPDTITFKTVAPSGVPASYVWGVDSAVEQAAQGVYFLTFTVDQAGPWIAGARGEDGDATNQVTFTAKRSIFEG